MTKYLQKSFTVSLGQNDSFRDNYDRAFGKLESVAELPDPLAPRTFEPLAVTVFLQPDCVEQLLGDSNDANVHTAVFRLVRDAVRRK